MDVGGRIAVISGGESGIGAACARRLRRVGAVPVTWDVTDDPDITCDVSDELSVRRAFQKTTARFGTPSLHIAAAGIAGTPLPFAEITATQWDRAMAVNLRGVFLTMREIAGGMVATGVGGAMVAISSVNGTLADPRQAAYSATRAGINHLCRIAALDLSAAGIRVNAIAPGPTSTPILEHLTAQAEYVEEIEAVTPLGRVGSPELIADAVLTVLTSEWTTG